VDQDAVGGGRHRRFGRGPSRCIDVDGERLVPALDRHHGVVHSDRDVGEDRVAFCRRQRRGAERLGADRVPLRDERVRWAGAVTLGLLTSTAARGRAAERHHRNRE
jgi:hypothetical protein